MKNAMLLMILVGGCTQVAITTTPEEGVYDVVTHTRVIYDSEFTSESVGWDESTVIVEAGMVEIGLYNDACRLQFVVDETGRFFDLLEDSPQTACLADNGTLFVPQVISGRVDTHSYFITISAPLPDGKSIIIRSTGTIFHE